MKQWFGLATNKAVFFANKTKILQFKVNAFNKTQFASFQSELIEARLLTPELSFLQTKKPKS